MEDEKVVFKELPQAAQHELREGADFIRKGLYHRSETEGYALRSENEALVERFPEVLAHFSDELGKGETRITAIRVENSAKLPVKMGATVILIPLETSVDTPTVDNTDLVFGRYARLTAGVPVELAIEGSFDSLLLLRQAVDA